MTANATQSYFQKIFGPHAKYIRGGFFPTPNDMIEQTPKQVVISDPMLQHMKTVSGGAYHVQCDEQLNAGDLVEFVGGINDSLLARLVTAEDPMPNVRLMSGHQIVTFKPVTKIVEYREERTNLAEHIETTFGYPFKPRTPAVEVCSACHRQVMRPAMLLELSSDGPQDGRYSIRCPHCGFITIGNSSEQVILRWNSNAALCATTLIFQK